MPDSRLSLSSIKYRVDGSNQAETATQTKPYKDSTKAGSLGYTALQAVALCTKANEAGWPIPVHAQGDAAIDQVLGAIETVYGAHPDMGLNSVEHATMVREDQIDRMKTLGCEPSFMTDFVYLYRADYRDTLFGPDHAAFMVPLGAALGAGIGYSLHADNPAAGMPLIPLQLVPTAMTRRCMVDDSIIGPDLSVTVDEALRGLTHHAARQMGLGDRIGTIESGKEADLTILEGGPYAADPEKLKGIRVSGTWSGGQKMTGDDGLTAGKSRLPRLSLPERGAPEKLVRPVGGPR